MGFLLIREGNLSRVIFLFMINNNNKHCIFILFLLFCWCVQNSKKSNLILGGKYESTGTTANMVNFLEIFFLLYLSRQNENNNYRKKEDKMGKLHRREIYYH